jgi:histidinol phosphatase-like enzyme
VDIGRSFLVGDKESDCQAARQAGIEPLLFRGGNLHDFLAARLKPVSHGLGLGTE